GEVVPGSEVLALACEGDYADGFVARGALDRFGERGVHGDGDRVAPLGPRQRDREHRAISFHSDMLIHALSPSLFSATSLVLIEERLITSPPPCGEGWVGARHRR